MKVELISPANLAYAASICQEFHAMSALNVIPFSWDHILETGRMMIARDDWYCALGKDEDDTYCGFVSGYVQPFFFSPKLQAIECCWYVREGTKGRTKLAIKLMNGMVDWAFNEKGAISLQSGDVANIDPLAVDEMYRRLGFKRFGTIFQREA